MEKETKETQKKAAPSSQAVAMRNDTIDLVELAYVLLRRWKMLVLFTVVGALLASSALAALSSVMVTPFL